MCKNTRTALAVELHASVNVPWCAHTVVRNNETLNRKL